MSNPNFDSRYAKPADVAAAISAQAVTDAGQYQKLLGFTSLPVPSGGDDTAAIQAVLNSGATYIIARSGTYSISSISVPAGITLYGTVPRTYTGIPANGTVFQQTGSGTTAVITINGRVTLEAIGIIGNTFATGVKMNGSSNTIKRCVVAKNVIGIDCNYAGTSLIDSNNINTNSGIGVNCPVDSSIRDNYINVNAPGIYLGAGANDNTISGNKLEFNSTNGISAYQSIHNVIINNVVDRNAAAGIKLIQCTQNSITGNMLRRNGGSQSSGSANEDCHLRIESCTDVVVGQNTTSTGANDDGSGYVSPKYCIYLQGNPGSVRITGNALLGYTVAALSTNGTNTDLSTSQNSTGQAEVSSRTRSALGTTVNTGSVAQNGTYTFTSSAVAMNTYSPGYLYQIDCVARDTSTGSRTAARTYIVSSREGGNVSLQTPSITNILGSEFGVSSTTTTMAFSINADGSVLTLTLTNTGANTKQYSISTM